MSWPGYLALAILSLLVANALWIRLANRQLRGRSVTDLVSVDPALANQRGKAAIYCYSAQCGPCRSLTPAIDALRADYPSLFKLDVAEHSAEARRLGIQAVPTILLIEDGQVLKALLGTRCLPALRTFLGAA